MNKIRLEYNFSNPTLIESILNQTFYFRYLFLLGTINFGHAHRIVDWTCNLKSERWISLVLVQLLFLCLFPKNNCIVYYIAILFFWKVYATASINKYHNTHNNFNMHLICLDFWIEDVWHCGRLPCKQHYCGVGIMHASILFYSLFEYKQLASLLIEYDTIPQMTNEN